MCVRLAGELIAEIGSSAIIPIPRQGQKEVNQNPLQPRLMC